MKQTLIYQNDFMEDAGQFLKEGYGSYEVKDGRLTMESLQTKIGQTVWLNRVFAGDLRITYEAMLIDPPGACNINIIFYASTADGRDILSEERSGAYEDYHKRSNAYIMTFCSTDQMKYTRFRKDPGFHLLSEDTNIYPKMNEKYFFELIKQKETVECKINGETVHRITDPEPYNKGSIGFRTYQSKLWYANFKVYALS